MAEGPYYTPDSPERSSLLEEGMEGTKLTITGFVLDTDCQPVEDAWLDFWQADAAGNYDNSGYILRGHQFTDAEGRYMLETVLPGEYPGRTQHIHVKVQVPGGRELVTQMFFPGAAGNSSDRIFDQELLVEMEETTGGLSATFNFVVETE
jgi:protocatechuate 3,4-dioxygenase beta subunit